LTPAGTNALAQESFNPIEHVSSEATPFSETRVGTIFFSSIFFAQRGNDDGFHHLFLLRGLNHLNRTFDKGTLKRNLLQRSSLATSETRSIWAFWMNVPADLMPGL
jgi:hypothetical protein